MDGERLRAGKSKYPKRDQENVVRCWKVKEIEEIPRGADVAGILATPKKEKKSTMKTKRNQ